MNAISVEGLAKRFDEVQAVADVSFEVCEGELFGFLGPNGAGKTTTINMLPLTYGADILHGAFNANHTLSLALDFCLLGAFCVFLFAWSLRNIKRRWIL